MNRSQFIEIIQLQPQKTAVRLAGYKLILITGHCSQHYSPTIEVSTFSCYLCMYNYSHHLIEMSSLPHFYR